MKYFNKDMKYYVDGTLLNELDNIFKNYMNMNINKDLFMFSMGEFAYKFNQFRENYEVSNEKHR